MQQVYFTYVTSHFFVLASPHPPLTVQNFLLEDLAKRNAQQPLDNANI